MYNIVYSLTQATISNCLGVAASYRFVTKNELVTESMNYGGVCRAGFGTTDTLICKLLMTMHILRCAFIPKIIFLTYLNDERNISLRLKRAQFV